MDEENDWKPLGGLPEDRPALDVGGGHGFLAGGRQSDDAVSNFSCSRQARGRECNKTYGAGGRGERRLNFCRR